jgi:hypothetical protein
MCANLGRMITDYRTLVETCRARADELALSRPGRCASRPVTEFACEFLLNHACPQIIIRSPHPRLGKFVASDLKRVLQHYPP